MRGWDQTQIIVRDIMEDLRKNGFTIPWDIHSLLIGEKPTYLKEMIKKHVVEDGITCVVLCDLIPDISDFEDTKAIWEEAQEAIDLIAKETGKKLPLSIVTSTGGNLIGAHPDFAEAALRMTRNELEACRIPEHAKVRIDPGRTRLSSRQRRRRCDRD